MPANTKRKITVGEKIKIWRKQRKLTQEKFADLIGRSTDAVSMIERGVNLPSNQTLEQMSKILNIPVGEFFVESNEKGTATERQEVITKILGLLHELDEKRLEMAFKHIEILKKDS
mgnify:CR=1 FL=1